MEPIVNGYVIGWIELVGSFLIGGAVAVVAESEALTWFDSHCHFDFEDFDGRRDYYWQRAQARGLGGMLIPGVEPAQWPRARTIAANFGLSHWAAGLHPWWLARNIEQLSLPQLAVLLAAAVALPDCVALGECGLDGGIELPLAQQLPWLQLQLQLAQEARLPVILHQHKAHNLMLQELGRYKDLRGIVHGFSGSIEMAAEYRRRGFMLGIGGVVTYARAAKTRAAVAQLEADSFLLETDAPAMPLAGMQGQINRPENLMLVAQEVAQLRGESLQDLARQQAHNRAMLFQ